MQYEMTGEIYDELVGALGEIVGKASPETRFETRRNALEVLRKISKSVILCNESQIRRELMKDGMLLDEFAQRMVELARGMTGKERKRYKEEGLFEKLIELQGECEEGDMDGLENLSAVLEDDDYDEEDVEEGNEEDKDFEASMPPAAKRTKVFSIGELS